ncbi:glycosyltransferase family 2 protein [Alteromonas hispanica]|uniref:Glycosyltransferase n=1 Tax=Alteromonas hispanica TaxID=315421 RepID=A0A6L9MTP6_9ALTE|nr:glycosyltransferase [Alteromonas hispanica]NDW21614.1 glycosyltransferase [Alteromonas hispanica]
MTKPLATIVVPFFNVEDYLDECLKSIFETKCDAFEVLLIDDGSTDGSSGIARHYCELFPNICRTIRQENMGIANARNEGIDSANGEWIIYVDSDDFVDPSALRKVLEECERTTADIIAYDAYKYVNDNGKLLNMYREPNPFTNEGIVDTNLYAKTLLDKQLLNFVTVWDKAYRKSALDKLAIRFIPGRIHEDVAFIIPLLLSHLKIEYINLKVVFYRVNREGSIMTAYNRNKLGHVIENIIMLNKFFKLNNVKDTVFYDYLVFLVGTVIKGKVKVDKRILWSLFTNSLSLRKRMILVFLAFKNIIGEPL